MKEFSNENRRRHLIFWSWPTILALFAAIVFGVSIGYTTTTSAHNIDLATAWEKARNYARQVRRDSDGKYTHYSTDCRELFAGGRHNHYVRCLVEYDDDETIKFPNGSRVCRETIDIYLFPHNRGISNFMNLIHHSGNCKIPH
jgi:hypothetical protein